MRSRFRVTAVIAGLVLILMAGGVALGASKPIVKIKKVDQYGKILTTRKGMTLYLYKPDSKNHSNCTGQCAALWPPYLVKKHTKLVKPKHLKGKLALIHRPGTKKLQVTFKGHPLYTYVSDTGPGIVTGQGVGGVWYVIHA